MGDTKVFLGGSCNPTTWRADIAVPILEAAGVSYYNPQVAGRPRETAAIEAAARIEADAKDSAAVLVYVIDAQTRAVASMVEVAELISVYRHLRLVVQDIADGTIIDGQVITGRELKDLNKGRIYLRELAERRYINVLVFDDIKSAVDSAVKWCTA